MRIAGALAGTVIGLILLIAPLRSGVAQAGPLVAHVALHGAAADPRPGDEPLLDSSMGETRSKLLQKLGAAGNEPLPEYVAGCAPVGERVQGSDLALRPTTFDGQEGRDRPRTLRVRSRGPPADSTVSPTCMARDLTRARAASERRLALVMF